MKCNSFPVLSLLQLKRMEKAVSSMTLILNPSWRVVFSLWPILLPSPLGWRLLYLYYAAHPDSPRSLRHGGGTWWVSGQNMSHKDKNTCGHCWRPRSWVITLGGFISFLNCRRHQSSATGWKRGNGLSHSCFKSPFSPYGFPAPGLMCLDLREKTHGTTSLPLVACRAVAAGGLQLQSRQPGRCEASLIPSLRCLPNCLKYHWPYEIYYFCTDL